MKKETQAAPAIAMAAPETATETNVVALETGGTRKSLFGTVEAGSETAIAKVTVLQDIRQKLAEANDLFQSGDDKAKEASAIADNCGVRLYQAMVVGIANAEETSSLLCDIFGRKPKADGTPGKTPFGQGEHLRKRVIRAVQAHECVTGKFSRPSAFFDGLSGDSADKDGRTIANVVTALSQGQLSIWSAYDYLAKIRRDNAETVKPAFDPKKVAAMVESLSQDGAADIVAASPALQAAYDALFSVMGTIAEGVIAAKQAEAKAA